jgi:hypothetical protein
MNIGRQNSSHPGQIMIYRENSSCKDIITSEGMGKLSI